jgi:hypothetical protein
MLTPRCGTVEILRFAEDDNVVDLALPAAARAPKRKPRQVMLNYFL